MNNDSIDAEIRQEDKQDVQVASLSELAILFIVTAIVLLLDLATKVIVENNLALYGTWAPFPEISHIFRFTHVSNTGAAFGLFPSGSNLFLVVAIIVSIVIVVYNHFLPKNHNLYRVALGLQLGGAVGNLLSRLRLGHVTDFLDFGPWPVFNVADMAVVSGVILLAYLMLVEEHRRLKEVKGSEQAKSDIESQTADDGEEASMLWNE